MRGHGGTLGDAGHLSAAGRGAGERAATLLTLLDKLQRPLNNAWRSASKAKDAAKLAAAQQAIEACEVEVRAAAKPVAMLIEIEKVSL